MQPLRYGISLYANEQDTQRRHDRCCIEHPFIQIRSNWSHNGVLQKWLGELWLISVLLHWPVPSSTVLHTIAACRCTKAELRRSGATVFIRHGHKSLEGTSSDSNSSLTKSSSAMSFAIDVNTPYSPCKWLQPAEGVHPSLLYDAKISVATLTSSPNE